MTLDKLIRRYNPYMKETTVQNKAYEKRYNVETPYHALLEEILDVTPQQPFNGFFHYSCKRLNEEGLSCSLNDIEKFSKTLFVYEEHKRFWRRAGKFLSAMISVWKEKNQDATCINLDFSAAKDPLSYACIKLKGCSIHITGSVGAYCGMHSKGCEIFIEGHAGYRLGHIADECTFEVSGKAGMELGSYANKCKYYVQESIISISLYCLTSEVYVKGTNKFYTQVFP